MKMGIFREEWSEEKKIRQWTPTLQQLRLPTRCAIRLHLPTLITSNRCHNLSRWSLPKSRWWMRHTQNRQVAHGIQMIRRVKEQIRSMTAALVTIPIIIRVAIIITRHHHQATTQNYLIIRRVEHLLGFWRNFMQTFFINVRLWILEYAYRCMKMKWYRFKNVVSFSCSHQKIQVKKFFQSDHETSP